jgi:hypothetical protein
VAVATRSELIEVLADQSAHDRIKGTSEGPWLDFKRDAYDLDRPKGRRDLISDVAAFANDQGGIVLLGVRAERVEGSQQELATELSPIPPERVDIERMLALIRSHVRPILQVDVRRYPHADQGDELVAVIVDPQPDHNKPFIVDRVADVGNDRDLPHAVGWPVRHGADTAWTDVGRIQQLISTGLRAAAPTSPPTRTPIAEDADEHLRMLQAADADWEHWAIIIIQAIPVATGEIVDFYGSFADTVGNWKGVREHGFDLNLDWGTTKVGSHLVAESSSQFVAVSRSGVVTAAAIGSPDFLGWSNHQNEDPDVVRINPYVIVEFPTETVRFAVEAVGPAVGATGWRYRVSGDRLTAPKPLHLVTRPGPLAFLGHSIEPIANTFTREVRSIGDVSVDAFNVVAEIFGSGFGAGRDLIPFADRGRVDLTMMTRV